MVDRSLEALWGIESLYNARRRPRGYVDRPAGFHVIEPRPALPKGDGWSWYLVRRVGMDSWRALKSLARLTGATRGGLLGLKDACSYATQYMALKGTGLPERLETPGFKAWLVGRAGSPRLGLHRYNIFKITLKAEDRVEVAGVEWVPGFYGPQRFGISRPNTHYLGLLHAEARMGEVIQEYLFRYPLEERSGPGGYEARELARLRAGMPRPRMLRIMAEALQSYIFNRALSRSLNNPREYAEHHVTVECMGSIYKAPAARLPGPRLESSRSRWAMLVGEILGEEGLSWQALRGLRSPFRPLLYPVCNLRSRDTPEGVMLRFALPRGAYATSLLRELADMDWIAYDECRLDGVQL